MSLKPVQCFMKHQIRTQKLIDIGNEMSVRYETENVLLKLYYFEMQKKNLSKYQYNNMYV